MTGLTVSTLVNLLVIRPDYSRPIKSKIQQLIHETGNLIASRGTEITRHQPLHRETRSDFQRILKDMESIETLCKYQKKEWKLHQFDRKNMQTYTVLLYRNVPDIRKQHKKKKTPQGGVSYSLITYPFPETSVFIGTLI